MIHVPDWGRVSRIVVDGMPALDVRPGTARVTVCAKAGGVMEGSVTAITVNGTEVLIALGRVVAVALAPAEPASP